MHLTESVLRGVIRNILLESRKDTARQEKIFAAAISEGLEKSRDKGVPLHVQLGPKGNSNTRTVIVNGYIDVGRQSGNKKYNILGQTHYLDGVLSVKDIKYNNVYRLSLKGPETPSIGGGGSTGISLIDPDLYHKFLESVRQHILDNNMIDSPVVKFYANLLRPEMKERNLAMMRGHDLQGGPIDFIVKGSMEPTWICDIVDKICLLKFEDLYLYTPEQYYDILANQEGKYLRIEVAPRSMKECEYDKNLLQKEPTRSNISKGIKKRYIVGQGLRGYEPPGIVQKRARLKELELILNSTGKNPITDAERKRYEEEMEELDYMLMEYDFDIPYATFEHDLGINIYTCGYSERLVPDQRVMLVDFKPSKTSIDVTDILMPKLKF